jgi:pimeloyl-ACP methyl ester carboxylesterase
MKRATLWFEGASGTRLAGNAFGDSDARTLLMLHGGGQTRHAWDASATQLADAGWRTITVDLRGHGESTHTRPAAYALEDFAADTRALISAVADDPVVVGASLGGIAALLAVTEPPAAPVAGLVLVDVAHRFQPRGGGRVVSFMEAHPDGFASLSEAADAVAAYLPHRVRPRAEDGLRHNLRRYRRRWIWHWDPEILTQARGLIGDQTELSERLTKAVAGLRQPCLLVRGGESDVVSASIAREFVDLAANGTLAEVPSAGHMVAGDNNDAFTAAIHAWLDAITTRPRPSRDRRSS